MIEDNSIHGQYLFTEMIKCTNYYELWHAKHLKLEPQVLIKVISKPLVEEYLIGQEVRIHSMTNDPYIAKFYQYFEEDEMSFIVMEHLNKQNFETYLSNHKSIPRDQARLWFSQIIHAIRYLDTNIQVFHGNLESGVFSLSQNNTLKLFDFENCQFYDSTEKSLSKNCHLFYVSPEEIRNISKPAATTIWRCGVILYKLLTGSFPFEDEIQSDLFMNILSMKPIIPSNVPSEAKDLIIKMLNKDQDDRITLEEIMEHPYLLKLPTPNNANTEMHIKTDIIHQLEAIGFQKQIVIGELKAKLFTEKTACYNILLNEGNYGEDSETSTESEPMPLYRSGSSSAFFNIISQQPKQQNDNEQQQQTHQQNSLMNKMKLRPLVPGRGIPLIPTKKVRRASSAKSVMDSFYQK